MTSTQTAKSRNPYLEGFLAPVGAEVTATDLDVTGQIPEHLDGRYLRKVKGEWAKGGMLPPVFPIGLPTPKVDPKATAPPPLAGTPGHRDVPLHRRGTDRGLTRPVRG